MSHGDIRLLLAAASWWLATIGTLLQGMGAVATVVVVLGGGLFCTHLIRRHSGHGQLLRYWAPTLCVLAASALLGASVTTAHGHLIHQGTMTELVEQGAVVTLHGTISSYPNPSGDTVLRNLDVTRVDGRGRTSDAHATVMLVGGDSLLHVGLHDTVTVQVRLEPAGRGSRHLAWATIIGPLTVDTPAGPLSRWIHQQAQHLGTNLDSEAPQIRGLVPGLAIGDDSGLPDNHGEALAAVNLTHLTAVSGSHVSMLCGIALGLVGRKRRTIAVLVSGGVLAALVVATGAQPSVMRAGVMGAVVLAAVWMRRPSSALPALGVSIVLLLATEPALALAYGFILSVVSTAAIIVWAGPAASLLAPVLTVPGANLLAVPIVAHLACGPIILFLTDTASIWSALANALVAPVVPAGTIFALLGLITATIPVVGPVFAWLAARCVSWIDIVARELSSWPGSGLSGMLVMTIYGALLITAWLVVRWKYRATWILLGVGGVIAIRLLPTPIPEWDIVQCDVGQGTATLVKMGELTYLIDTGPPEGRLEACLRASGATPDIVILTHLHADHAGLLMTALDHGAREVWVGPGLTEQVKEAGVEVPIREISTGMELPGIDVLWPDNPRICADDTCINNQSLVLKFHLDHTLLVTGDIEPRAQQQLAARDVAADIIVVPHHGSPRQDEGFAAAVSARLALLSFGENTYGHPAPSTVSLYETFGDVLSTDTGDIFIHTRSAK